MRFLLLSLLLILPILAFSEPTPLFQPLTPSMRVSEVGQNSSGHIAATTYGLVNHSATLGDFSLTLDSKTYAATIKRISEWHGGVSRPLRTIEGSLSFAGLEEGNFTITETSDRSDRVLMSHFLLRDGRAFRLASRSSIAVLREVSVDTLPECEHPPHAPRASQVSVTRSATQDSTELATIDVMIVYSPEARIGAGGTAEIESEVANAITMANTAYSESGIGLQLQLVGTYELDSPESGSMSQDLVSLTETDDAKWDNIHDLRNESGADLVTALLDNNSSCGLGWVMTSPEAFPDFGFSVISRDCIGNHSLAHELGHNMGAQHNVENAGTGGAYAHSYGWRFTGDSEGALRTIMAYTPGLRINRFSNPNISYDGQALGKLGEADNASTLESTKIIVAAYRAAASPTPISSTPTPTVAATPTATATPIETSPNPAPVLSPTPENPLTSEPTAPVPIPSSTPTALPEASRVQQLAVIRKISRQGLVIFITTALDAEGKPVAMEPIVLHEAYVGPTQTRLTNRRGTARFKVSAQGEYYFSVGEFLSKTYVIKRSRNRRRNRQASHKIR